MHYHMKIPERESKLPNCAQSRHHTLKVQQCHRIKEKRSPGPLRILTVNDRYVTMTHYKKGCALSLVGHHLGHTQVGQPGTWDSESRAPSSLSRFLSSRSQTASLPQSPGTFAGAGAKGPQHLYNALLGRSFGRPDIIPVPGSFWPLCGGDRYQALFHVSSGTLMPSAPLAPRGATLAMKRRCWKAKGAAPAASQAHLGTSPASGSARSASPGPPTASV